jgi:hypothetical protein
MILIKVKDNGLGMSKVAQKKKEKFLQENIPEIYTT